MNFELSTHGRCWLFKKTTLQRVLYEANAAAKDGIRRRQNLFDPRDGACERSDGLRERAVAAQAVPKEEQSVDMLSAAEETSVKVFYLAKILDTVCNRADVEARRQTENVHATARAFFQRFYLSNSIMDFDPKLIMLASVFLAGKVEERSVDVYKLQADTGIQANAIMDMELVLLKGLRCQLTVWHPYRALRGFLEDARSRKAGKSALAPLTPELLVELAQRVADVIDDALVTDLPLVHPPAIIGLAALLEAASKQQEGGGGGGDSGTPNSAPLVDVDAYLAAIVKDSSRIEAARREVEAVREALRPLPLAPDMKALKAINKKLKKCARWAASDAKNGTGAAAVAGSKRPREVKSESGVKTEATAVKNEAGSAAAASAAAVLPARVTVKVKPEPTERNGTSPITYSKHDK